jgi:hypothetical protein
MAQALCIFFFIFFIKENTPLLLPQAWGFASGAVKMVG